MKRSFTLPFLINEGEVKSLIPVRIRDGARTETHFFLKGLCIPIPSFI